MKGETENRIAKVEICGKEYTVTEHCNLGGGSTIMVNGKILVAFKTRITDSEFAVGCSKLENITSLNFEL